MWRVAREATRQTRWLVLGQTKSVGTDGSRLEGGCRSLAGTIFMRMFGRPDDGLGRLRRHIIAQMYAKFGD